MINHDISRLIMTNHHPIGRGISFSLGSNSVNIEKPFLVPGPGGFYLPRNETSYDPMHFDLEVI